MIQTVSNRPENETLKSLTRLILDEFPLVSREISARSTICIERN